jgi:hypothetical protein
MKFDRASLAICILLSAAANAQDWQPVTGQAALTEIVSDSRLEGTLKGDVTGVARYNADGTAVLEAWGGKFERRWRVENDDKICVEAGNESWCTSIERNASDPDEYRATRLDTGEQVVFSLTGQAASKASTAPADSSGGPAQPSAEELALKLSNPTAPVMTLGNNFDFVMFDGDLDGASDETAFRYTFQSVFPFKRDDGSSIFFRPAIPVFFGESVPSAGGGFDSVGTDLGDNGFELSYGRTTDTGMILGGGVAGTLPTATDDRLGKDLFGLGPALLVGKIGKWGAVVGVLSHQWDVGGSGDGSINTTSLNYVYAFQLGGGWQFSSAPAISYNHDAEDGQEWTVPLGVGVSRTMVLKGRPWKFQLQYWNYIERGDVFAPEHQIRFSASPVVSAPWNE